MSAPIKRPTLRDVGRAAGVDASIASRVLGGETSRVQPATRERILAAARELGWRPHAGARSLRTGSSSTIAAIVPSLHNPAYGSMILGAQRAAAAADHVVVFADCGDDADRAAGEVDRLASYVDGIVLASVRTTNAALSAAGVLHVPVVLLNRRDASGLPAVIGRDEDGAALAASHLVNLGHERIAVLAGPEDVETANRRLAGFSDRLRGLGCALDGQMAVRSELTIEAAAEAMRPILSGRETEPPTAVFVAAGINATFGVLKAARDLGVTVPRQLSVIGFDDAPVADLVSPALTTVRMPHEAMGAAAVTVLLGLIRGEQTEDVTVVEEEPQIIERASTRRLVKRRVRT